jgi:hypothetical protein
MLDARRYNGLLIPVMLDARRYNGLLKPTCRPWMRCR